MTRVVTSLLLIPFISYVVLWAPQWVFLAVLSAVALLCFHEFSGIASAHGLRLPGPVGYAAGLLVLLLPNPQGILVTLLALLSLTLALRSRDLSHALPQAAALLLGVVYVFGAWRCAVELRLLSPYWLLFALALSWAGDIAAYYIGRATGRHKMAPRISPAKSWEGAAGSLVVSLLLAALYLDRLLPSVPRLEGLAIAAAGNLAGQLGDMAESALKRGAHLKDSSGLLPGHGGWLDRVDSSLFALPVIYCLLAWQR